MQGRLIFLHFQMRAYDIKYGTVLADRICELSSDFGVAVIKSLHRNETAHECYDLIAVMIADVTAGGIDKIPVSLFSGITTVLQSIILDLEVRHHSRVHSHPLSLFLINSLQCVHCPFSRLHSPHLHVFSRAHSMASLLLWPNYLYITSPCASIHTNLH